MKLTSALMLGCLCCCVSNVFADGPNTRAASSSAVPWPVAKVASASTSGSQTMGVQAEIEGDAAFQQAVSVSDDMGCTSAQAAFGPNRCPRPTMNQYVSPPFSYQIWASYPAQKACEEMRRDQLLFSPCPGGICCRRPLSGACGKAHCVNGLSGCPQACGTGACGLGGYGMAGCATGACGIGGCSLGHGLLRGKASNCNSGEATCDMSLQAQSQAPVLPLAAFGRESAVK